jgi:hypothetical protein
MTMRNPITKCGNCLAYEPSEKIEGQGSCHREPIKGHVVIGAPEIDLRVNPHAQNRPNFKIVPSFPPSLENLWCMAFVPTAEALKGLTDSQSLGTIPIGEEIVKK